jgi:two-component system, OmpR family, copper resistance phosphate regulon response regulator CusR
MGRILIAEQDKRCASFLDRGLRANAFTASTVGDANRAVAFLSTGEFDLLLLDLDFPSSEAWTVLRKATSTHRRFPVIVLSRRDDVRSVVEALEGGADDCLTKPFQFDELLARIRLRISPDRAVRSSVLTAGELSLDLRTRRAHIGTRTVDLTAHEFGLLELFLRNRHQVLTRDQILSHVWGYPVEATSNVIEVVLCTLRRKIGPDRIATVRGAGYRCA